MMNTNYNTLMRIFYGIVFTLLVVMNFLVYQVIQEVSIWLIVLNITILIRFIRAVLLIKITCEN
jgi:hypothetical protein